MDATHLRHVPSRFPLRAYHPLRDDFPDVFECRSGYQPHPHLPKDSGRPVPFSISSTGGITIVFFSCHYYDASVQGVALPDKSGIPRLIGERSLIRGPWDRSLLAAPPGLSQPVAPFIGQRSQEIHHNASPSRRHSSQARPATFTT